MATSKRKILITLAGEAVDVLDWLKTNRDLEPSAALAFVLREWWDNRTVAKAPMAIQDEAVVQLGD